MSRNEETTTTSSSGGGPNNTSGNSNNDWWKPTLQVVDPSLSSSGSLFGVDPWKEDVIVQSTTPFDSWKGWMKVSSRFYNKKKTQQQSSSSDDERTRNDEEVNKPPANFRYLVHAPFFLRAARFWQRIFHWCDHVDSITGNGSTFGRTIKSSLGGPQEKQRGLHHGNWVESCQYQKGLEACYAVFALNRGQNVPLSRYPMHGIMGGYSAYGCNSSIALTCLDGQSVVLEGTVPGIFGARHATKKLVGIDARGMGSVHDFPRVFLVDTQTGALECFVVQASSETVIRRDNDDDNEIQRGGRGRCHRCHDRKDDLLLWLEEHVRRLERGLIWVEKVAVHNYFLECITLYPQFPHFSTPVITEGVQPVSRAVTRGVEVIASAVYVPQSRRFGFIYSVRIRLLTPSITESMQDGNDSYGYESAAQRGFETCQLLSRHWRISDDVAGTTHAVDGEGVIGMYPLLREGGYTEGGVQHDCVFQYQSCTGGAMTHGSFAGHLLFVPGSLDSPTGPPFSVEVKPFGLKPPQFLY